MSYKYETQYDSPNYTPASQAVATWGRARTIEAIAIHWWGDPNTGPSYEGVINTLCNPSRGASAHFVATGTGRRVACLVNLQDASWATNSANPYTISIECDPRCRNEDYDVVAELIAQIRQVYGNLPLVPHRQFVATACPGNYDLGRLDREARKKIAKPEWDWGHVENPVTTKPVPAAVKLPNILKFKAKLNPTSVWDLSTNPNYKAATTLKQGSGFEAYATIDFNNTRYYVTKYSFDKGLKVGVNVADLVAVVDPPKETTPPVVIPPVTEPEKPPVVTEPTESEPEKPSEPESGTDTQPDKDETKGLLQNIIKAIKPLWDLLVKLWNAKY